MWLFSHAHWRCRHWLAWNPKVLSLTNGAEIILDGDRGHIRLNPSASEKAEAARLQHEQFTKRQAALAISHQAASTTDGVRIEVAANIGSVADAKEPPGRSRWHRSPAL